MLRSFLLTSATALALVIPLGFASTAQAGPRVRFDLRVSNYGRGPQVGLRVSQPGFAAPVLAPTPGFVPPAPYGSGLAPRVTYHDNHYHVMFRTCPHDPWREYGSYNCHELAHEVEVSLIRRGYQARVVHH